LEILVRRRSQRFPDHVQAHFPARGIAPGNSKLESRTEAAGRHQTIRNNGKRKNTKRNFTKAQKSGYFRIQILDLFRVSSFGFRIFKTVP
jgi:hypothetical protein